ncbi:MAG: AraC family transcriptional regulator [Verrucomicrobiales bacterium]|nr:AraC family transcriptional regulator [Verrucomicrobiales bacterium]
MIYPKEQLKNLIKLEDSSPWSSAKRGWRVELLNEDSGLNDFTFSTIEADISKDINYDCCSDEEGLLLRVCLEGSGTISTAGVKQDYFPNMVVAIQVAPYGKINCFHKKGRQRFVNFRFTTSFLRSIFENDKEKIRAGLSALIFENDRVEGEAPFILREFLRTEERDIAESVANPSISGAAGKLWFKAKAMELLSGWSYADSRDNKEFFCSRQKRAVLERVDKAKEYLSDNLQSPLDLNSVAKSCACSPHYLSRLFAAETGMTLSLYLRKLRINKACGLLSSGRLNVSEASLEVGYQSLSHFARAFRGVVGVSPSQYARSL